MQIRYGSIIIGLILALSMTHIPVTIWAGTIVDHSIYGQLLNAHVKNGHVDYGGFKKDEQRLNDYLSLLEQVDPMELNHSEKMAFYINVYNAWTIKLIIDNYPGVKSIKELGTLFQSPWKKKFVKVDGNTVTLDYIEHDILRPVFKDPRIHFAVNCASKSCPPLLAEPYTGADLERQLDQAAKEFINDPSNNYIEGRTLYVSRIFKWFNKDFGGNVLGFVSTYARGDLAKRIERDKALIKIKYLKYDWSLNGT